MRHSCCYEHAALLGSDKFLSYRRKLVLTRRSSTARVIIAARELDLPGERGIPDNEPHSASFPLGGIIPRHGTHHIQARAHTCTTCRRAHTHAPHASARTHMPLDVDAGPGGSLWHSGSYTACATCVLAYSLAACCMFNTNTSGTGLIRSAALCSSMALCVVPGGSCLPRQWCCYASPAALPSVLGSFFCACSWISFLL